MTSGISIVIPVFKTERYILDCLDSVLSQLPANCEVIVVDDGSPDSSIELIEKYFHPWIASQSLKILRFQNGGPGFARNRGIDSARYEYVGFLDSDDVLFSDYFSTLQPILERDNPDVIEFGFKRFISKNDLAKAVAIIPTELEGLCRLDDVRNSAFRAGTWFPSLRVFRTMLFDDIQFSEGVFYEDWMTIPLIFMKDLRVFFLNKPLWGYRVNPGSTTSNHSATHADQLLSFLERTTAGQTLVPMQILAVQIVRAIAYFRAELGPLNFPMSSVFKHLEMLRGDGELVRELNVRDRMLLCFPRAYLALEMARLFVLGRRKSTKLSAK